MTDTDRAEGVLLGLACGDALGRPVEFRSQAGIEREYGRLTEMVGDGAHRKPAGTITDDTELALCIARSVVERGRFDGADVADRFVEWYRSDPFDIGGLTADALRLVDEGVPWDEAGLRCWETLPEGQNAGNGSVMRCAPYALAFAEESERLVTVSRQSSAITHADPRCTDSCAVLNLTIAALLDGSSTPLADALDYVRADAPDELIEALEPVPDVDETALRNTGYVVDTLQTALTDALAADNARDAIVSAVNRGGDADSIGAVAGAVAGARFGASDLPERWLATIPESDELRRLASDLSTGSY